MIALFVYSKWLRFLMTLELRYILARLNCVRKFYYKAVVFWFYHYLNLIFRKINSSVDKTTAHFYNELLHFFGFL